MTMKFNWGTGAFMLFGSFALFMTGLAIFASQQRNELVTENYYEKELEFKEVLKKQERTGLLLGQLSWEIKGKEFILNFPKEIENEITGTITFFKPSREKDDKNVYFKSASNQYVIDISDYALGMYKISIDWKANGVEYYNKDEVVIH